MAVGSQVRAVLVALHLVVIGLAAFPAPVGGMNRSSWRDPTVRAELDAWRGRFAAAGVEMTAPEFEDRLWSAMTAFMRARGAIVDPIQPYFEVTGAWQSWRMFVAPQRYPARLSVDVFEDGAWVPLFEERSATATWNRALFDHDRLRSAVFRYAWPKFDKEWKVFAGWLGERAAVDRPRAEQLRARFFRYRTLTPDEALAGVEPTGKFEREILVDLAPLR